MANTQQRSVSDNRPALHGSRSFTRMPSPSSESPRKRASTMQESGIPPIPEARNIGNSPEVDGKKKTDVFENHEEDEDEGPVEGSVSSPNPDLKLPSTFDELPIEIKSLTERFLDSLNAKVHPTPLTADALSDLFQDFYERAASHINTHISTLASRIGRKKTPQAANGKIRTRAGSSTIRNGSPASGGEMLTVSEVADRKKARKLLELKRIALEEAVERSVCEKVYDRIFKHKSTDDEARDEKLRSRTAALAVVGIGLKDLHMDIDRAKLDVGSSTQDKEAAIHTSLGDAREALQAMDEEHYPAGKLQHLNAAHKSIVETLSQMFPSSSSADEILPTLIYTLITSPPEGINIVSNLNFIQRFRTQSKVDGEAAYCLVNLEAAISFLETVDLSSLRADEAPEGPAKPNSRPSTPNSDTKMPPTQPLPAKTLKPGLSPATASTPELTSSSPSAAETTSRAMSSPRTPSSVSVPGNGTRPTMQHRRLSSLVQAQADRLEAGRENILNAADKVYDSINGTLETSLQFVFGRFKEQAAGSSDLPKTLEEARKLVSSPTMEEREEDALTASGRSSPSLDDPLNNHRKASEGENKMLELIGGRKHQQQPQQLRDRSVDSTRSGGSGKRVAFSEVAAKDKPKEEQSAVPGANLFNAINPLNRFQVPGFARFGNRSGSIGASTNSAVQTPTTEKPNKLEGIVESPVSKDGASEPFPKLEKQSTRDSTGSDGEGMNAREALAELRKIKPPKKRFLDVGSAQELRLGEVEELLAEYRRLAKAIGEAVVQ
ncbi:hypothetical protein D0862_02282 [Hortaea werneckii]|uniref:VPS9 domain-containing protein n=1 Tax=Hortaea werneckii TaxID=91943 RepID=A0A3M7HJY3_HORWE|nr:hypothetical protein D0862_02282 [Hortaea werneckii]